MKCLMKYQWAKLPRALVPAGRGIMGVWTRLAARAAFPKGEAAYCGHINAVTPGMWAGGVVGLKSIPWAPRQRKTLRRLQCSPIRGFCAMTSLSRNCKNCRSYIYDCRYRETGKRGKRSRGRDPDGQMDLNKPWYELYSFG